MGTAKAYGSHAELLADPDIEAIYNPLPNDQHLAMTLTKTLAICNRRILDARFKSGQTGQWQDV